MRLLLSSGEGIPLKGLFVACLPQRVASPLWHLNNRRGCLSPDLAASWRWSFPVPHPRDEQTRCSPRGAGGESQFLTGGEVMSEKALADVQRELSKPFSTKVVQWRPGKTNREKTRAMALAYVDLREYQARLDEVVPGAWEVRVAPIGEGVLKISLTIMGHTREDVGEASPEDENTYTSAFAQGFKRACAAFGLGRYLYRLPKPWVDYDRDRRVLLETPILPEWAVPEEERSWYFATRGGSITPTAEAPAPNDEAARGKAQANGNGKGQDPATVVIRFGKHRGKTLGQILAEDAGYLRWLVEKSTNQFIVEKARAVLAQANGNGQGQTNADFDDIPF